jgi:hypothetical protein
MSQVPGLRRARQLTASVLPIRAADGDPSLIAGRLRKLDAAGSTGMLPFSGGGDGAIYFRDGKVIYAESDRTPGPAASTYQAYADGLPPLGQIMAIRAVTEPIIDAALELFTAQVRQAKFRPARLPDVALSSGIGVETLLAEIGRRQRLMKQLSAVLTPETVVSRNPHLRSDSVRISAGQWALLIRVTHGSTPRNLAWELGRSVFCTVVDVYRLLVLRLLLAAGQVPENGLAVMSFVRAASLKKGDTMPVIDARTAAEDAL